MKSFGIVRATVLIVSCGSFVSAGAVEPKNKPPAQEAPSATPATAAETPVDETRQAAWEEKQADLLKVLEEVVAGHAAGQKEDTTTNWTAVKKSAFDRIFEQSERGGDGSWPVLQLSWAEGAVRELSHAQRRKGADFDSEKVLLIIEKVAASLRETSRDLGQQANDNVLSKWREEQVQLVRVISERVAAYAAAQPSDIATDWDAVEKSVSELIFKYAARGAEGAWPVMQLSWAEVTLRELSRAEKRSRDGFEFELELRIIREVATALRNEAKTSVVAEAPDAKEDETLWRFLDKSGSRTTRARHKGQEPVN